MAPKIAAVVTFLAILLPLIATFVVGQALIPQNKAQVNSWFQTNVGYISTRRSTLDPALVTAEASPKIIKVNAKGGADFKSITDAIKSVPVKNTQRVIISVAGGTYNEKVKIDRERPFITLAGAHGAEVILVAGNTAAKFGTVDSATLIVESDYFMAVNMIIKNSAPIPTGKSSKEQALALRITGDKAAFYQCKIYGYQDTLCDDKGNHFFKDCHIEGTVDFIFGNAKSIYLNTELFVIKSGGYTMITAHARASKSEDTGFSFVHCTVSGNATNAVLGRAWMPAPRVVYSYTQMTNAVSPEGWSDNFHPERDGTVYYGEYKNMGPGADVSKRAKFSKSLSDAEAKIYLSLDFIGGSKWLLPPPSKY